MDSEWSRASHHEFLDSPTKEWRRLHALHLKEFGWKQRDIATALDVTEDAVSQWMSAAQAGGTTGLYSHMAHARHPKLMAEQKRLTPDFLWHGAEAYGFRGEFWICARLVKVLEWELRISYSKSQVSRLLISIGWTRQVSITVAIQSDDGAMAQWRRHVWPQFKEQALSEAGGKLRP